MRRVASQTKPSAPGGLQLWPSSASWPGTMDWLRWVRTVGILGAAAEWLVK